MPRTTRSGNIPKANAKSTKKPKDSGSAPPRSRGRPSSSLPLESSPTPTRTAATSRKRGIEKSGDVSPRSATKSVLLSPKRRRGPGSSSSSSSKSAGRQSVDAIKIKANPVDVVEAAEKLSIPSRKSLGVRKRKIEPVVSENLSGNSPPVAQALSKKAKVSSSASSKSANTLSPKVVVSPLKTPLKSRESVSLPASELSPTIRLTTLSSLNSPATCVKRDLPEKADIPDSPSPANATDSSSCTGEAVNCTKKSPILSEAAAPSAASTTQVQIPDNGTPSIVPPLNAISIASNPIKKLVIPPKLTKQELVASQRRSLLQRLDHYDLSDLTNTSNLLAGWPKVDVKPSVEPLCPVETTKSSQRIWVSREDLSLNVEANRPTVNGIPEAQVTKQIIVDEAPPVSDSINVTDSFCVASFTLTTSRNNRPDIHSQMSEHEKILREIEVIKPDVFCVRNADLEYSANCLRPELGRRGFSSSDFPAGLAVVNPSFIFYNEATFVEIAFHHLAVQAVARKLATLSAYPQSWRDALCQSFSSTLFMSSTSADNSGPELLVSVLRHTKSGAIILVACLTDKPSPAIFDDLSQALTSHVHSQFSPHPITITTRNSGDELSVDAEPPHLVPMPLLRVSMDWNCIPHVTCPAGALTTTVSMSRPGCSVSASSEWCPPSFSSRPDLAAVNAAGAFLALEDIWNEIFESDSDNPYVSTHHTRLPNGFGNGGLDVNHDGKPEFRWVLCANLEASPSSPAYQICRAGYPSDESLERLRSVRNIHLEGHEYLDSTSLIDLLWHAFQHSLTDVVSCYDSVMGQEPPFTRFTPTSSSSLSTEPQLIPRKCVDYIFCSSTTLHPEAVFLPPCRALVTTTANVQQRPTAHPLSCGTEISLPLATRIGILSTVQN